MTRRTVPHPSGRVLRVIIVLVAVQAAAFAAKTLASRRLDSGDVDDEEVRRAAVLGGVDLALTSGSLRRARFDVGLGGVNLDLTEAVPDPAGATIEVHGVLGGVNVVVPRSWRVTATKDQASTGLNIASELLDEREQGVPELTVHASSRMSGVNIDVR